MPSLLKFLTFIGVLAGIAFGTMFALAEFIEPEQSEITYKIPNRDMNN
jgi:hypothetical protein